MSRLCSRHCTSIQHAGRESTVLARCSKHHTVYAIERMLSGCDWQNVSALPFLLWQAYMMR